MGKVRGLRESDIPSLVQIQLATQPKHPFPEALARHFKEIYLENPWYSEELPPLVYETDEGRVVGFIGRVPRPMLINGRRILAAVCAHLMVDPQSQGRGIAVRMGKVLLHQGPQDISIGDDANVAARKLWEIVGGGTSFLHSLTWTCVLRPSVYLLLKLRRGHGARKAASLLTPFCRVADHFATRVFPARFLPTLPPLSAEDADAAALIQCVSEFSDSQNLRPEYDVRSLEWLLAMASRHTVHGVLRKAVLRDSKGQIAGSYVYYERPGGVSDVLAMTARKEATLQVFDHLLCTAREQGAVAVSGRLQSQFAEAFAERNVFFEHGQWALVHSKDPEVAQAFCAGNAFWSHLEGEWCLRFNVPR